ncbi:MAG: flagellar hook-associated protein FlgK [Parvularcula sp.]|jgi:flagellar hook-associated protein 1 FlgK|nr:flagellar hook-associated protein FlgK [Parvularcula sp.]
MSLTTALNNAKSGLAATQRQVAGSSNNIANARTPGYVAVEARITSRVIDGYGTGVATTIERSQVDEILLRDVRLEAARLGFLDVRSAMTERVANVSGDPADQRSLAYAFTRFETQLQELFDAPERGDLQRQVYYAAEEITTRLNDLQTAVQGARIEADRKIEESVGIVNDALLRIEDLNNRVAEGTFGDTDIASVLDERDRLIDVVAEQIGIRTFERPGGEVVITTTEGVTLLDGDARTLDFSRTNGITPEAVIGATAPTPALSGLTVDGFEIAPSANQTQSIRSGIIAGLFVARDQDLVDYQAQIDALAKETIVAFQQADATLPAAPPFNASIFSIDAGAPPAGVDPAATAADVIGLAGTIRVNPLFDPNTGDPARFRDGVNPPVPGNPAGFNGQITAWLDALSNDRNFAPAAGLTNAITLQGFATELSTGHQNDRANLENSADRVRTVFETLELRRYNENGVNVDEESERLLELEQAYAANAQVINVIARMFDELLARIA